MSQKDQSPRSKRPPILVKYVDRESQGEVDAKILSYEDEDLTHDAYGKEVIEGWDKITAIYGEDAPVIIAALGHALEEWHIEGREEALEEFVEEYFKSECDDKQDWFGDC